jgi:3-hydroxyisobutyrate dehydrogenase
MTTTLGFLGLGQMGAAIAERLQSAGHTLQVFDPSPVAVAPFVARGAVAQASATAVADTAEIVFACLSAAVESSPDVGREYSPLRCVTGACRG